MRGTGAWKWLDENGRLLWSNGCIDRVIAAKIGCVKSLVCMWRKRNELKANAPRGSEDWHASLETSLRKRSEVIDLHEKGFSDAQVAMILGITVKAAWHRRVRLGLRRRTEMEILLASILILVPVPRPEPDDKQTPIKPPELPAKSNWGDITVIGKEITIDGHADWVAEGRLHKDGWLILEWTYRWDGRKGIGVHRYDAKTKEWPGVWGWRGECQLNERRELEGATSGDILRKAEP